MHHVMSRGVDRALIFLDDFDRREFRLRLTRCVDETDVEVLAWVLMPNHFHILTKTGEVPLSRFMSKLLTGYAGYFNRKHDRVGHLFQGRYKSVLVQYDSYYLKLVRYIHLNPLHSKVVRDKYSLDKYRWGSHHSILYPSAFDIIDRNSILQMFTGTYAEKLQSYKEYLYSEEISQEDETKYDNGSYILNSEGILQKENTDVEFRLPTSQQILGDKKFALQVLSHLTPRQRADVRQRADQHNDVILLLTYAENKWGVSERMLQSSSRRPTCTRSREFLAYAFVVKLGMSYSDVGKIINLSRAGVYKAVERAEPYKEHFNSIIQSIVEL